MSKVGKMHINVPSSVKVSLNGKTLHFEGANGKRDYAIPEGIDVKIDNGVINFLCVGEHTISSLGILKNNQSTVLNESPGTFSISTFGKKTPFLP